jgi:hypothetical protein
MGHNDSKMTARYTTCPRTICDRWLLSFRRSNKKILETKSPQIPPEEEKQNVVNFGR